MSKSDTEKVVSEATTDPEVIDYDSDDHSDNYEDASEGHGDGIHDLTKPSDWKPKDIVDSHDDVKEEPCEDSTGHEKGSPDYIDEELLRSWEVGDEALSEAELEQKRLEAAQYKLEGNALYLEGKTIEALDKYTAGLRVCPLKFSSDRAVLYANRGQMKRVLGLNDHAVKNCTKAVELNPQYLKALLRRAEIYEETDKLGTVTSASEDDDDTDDIVDEALKDYQTVLTMEPRHVAANKAVRSLPAKIEERNEKMKAEMIDNLKKLGNMVLNPFGLSTDNFKMEQNESGSYNIQFQQNK